MRNPRRARTIALVFFIVGCIAVAAAFLLPDEPGHTALPATLFTGGLMAIIFGGGTAIFRHLDARAQERLARGEDVIARWRVTPAAWEEFVTQDRQRGEETDALPNELWLSLPDHIPAEGIEVVVGRAAVQIGDSIHRLPRRGTPEINDAILHDDGPGLIELRLYYPAGGTGASGVPQSARRTALRFPVGRGFWREAAGVVAHFRGDLGGDADFFHGKGDGSNREDLSTCIDCGFQTHRYVSHCPQCGGGMQSRRWARRFGIGLVFCGIFITAIMSVVLLLVGPKLLAAAFASGAAGFSGTPGEARMALAVMGVVELFGVTALGYGVFQIVTGRRNKRIIYFALALVAVVLLLALII